MKAYVSGALSERPNIEALKKFYEKIGNLCTESGIDAYIPHLHSIR